MAHGDKAKVKTVKASSKTSGQKASKVAGKSIKAGSKTSGKGEVAGKTAGKTGKKGFASPEKSGGQKPVPQKAAVAKAPPQKSSPISKEAAPKGGPAKAPIDGIPITNAIIANAFKRAIKKYPNAFRKLTD